MFVLNLDVFAVFGAREASCHTLITCRITCFDALGNKELHILRILHPLRGTELPFMVRNSRKDMTGVAELSPFLPSVESLAASQKRMASTCCESIRATVVRAWLTAC